MSTGYNRSWYSRHEQKKKIKIPPSPRDHMGSKKKKIFRVIFIKSQTFLCYSFYDYYFSFRVEKEEKCYRCLFIAQKHPNVLQYKECMAIFLFRVVVVVFLCGDPPSHIGPMSRYRESHFLWLYLMRFELVLWCLVVSWIPSFDVSVWVTMKGKKKKMLGRTRSLWTYTRVKMKKTNKYIWSERWKNKI